MSEKPPPMPSNAQHSEAHAAEDVPLWARMRSDSTDSVRGAFYQKQSLPPKSNILQYQSRTTSTSTEKAVEDADVTAKHGRGKVGGRRTRHRTKNSNSTGGPMESVGHTRNGKIRIAGMAGPSNSPMDESLNRAESGEAGNRRDSSTFSGTSRDASVLSTSLVSHESGETMRRRNFIQQSQASSQMFAPSNPIDAYYPPTDSPANDVATRSTSSSLRDSSVIDYSSMFSGDRLSLNSNNRTSSLYGANLMESFEYGGAPYLSADHQTFSASSPPSPARGSREIDLQISSRPSAPVSSPYQWLNSLSESSHGAEASGTASIEEMMWQEHFRAPAASNVNFSAPSHDLYIQNSSNGDNFGSDSVYSSSRENDNDSDDGAANYWSPFTWWNPAIWLTRDVKVSPDGVPYFEVTSPWRPSACIRHFFWDPLHPEFTALQLFVWAILIGAVMGVYTALWKWFIEYCIEQVWVTFPTHLLQWGVFTGIQGRFPLYHYMWICPAAMGGCISYIQTVLPVKIPDQNDWIRNLHTLGVQDHRTFCSLFFISTAGMASGLSLGPELPLVLTAGMFGSWLGIICKQSILQARVLNLTAASAAVGGFFGFPMAGALFVLEIPHRMGLQYFEALSPATVSSIVAVLSNRLMVGNDVTGYYSYPFLTATLPSEIFTSAIFYGFWGAFVGIVYAHSCKKVKTWVQGWFQPVQGGSQSHGLQMGSHGFTKAHEFESSATDETTPLTEERHESKFTGRSGVKVSSKIRRAARCAIPNEATRASVIGTIVGAAVGVICMFIPHSMFWGEAQLQTLIDKGRTPLPVFGIGDEPTSALVALSHCMIDPNDGAAVMKGFGLHCSFLISAAKILTTGLSLGTGITGGHFWGPLFVGCSAGHFLWAVVKIFSDATGYGATIGRYPCVVILCTMGSTHVVTFRAHMAIMLILTLTISAFDPEDGKNGMVAGDYSAVLPLLVVSVFVSLMLSRSTVFYPTQRSRGDILAVPEALCEPGMEGRPMVMEYFTEPSDDSIPPRSGLEGGTESHRSAEAASLQSLTSADIERNFLDTIASPSTKHESMLSPFSTTEPLTSSFKTADVSNLPFDTAFDRLSSARLDELLKSPLKPSESFNHRSAYPPSHHRRIQSAPTDGDPSIDLSSARTNAMDMRLDFGTIDGGVSFGNRERSNSSSSKGLVRVAAYGQVHDLQPSLLDQARNRAASASVDSCHSRVSSFSQGTSTTKHVRRDSGSSAGSAGGGRPPSSAAASAAASSKHQHVRKGSEPLSLSVPYAIRRSAREGFMTHGAASPPLDLFDGVAAGAAAATATDGSSIPGSGALSLDDIYHTFDAKLESFMQQQNP